MKKDEPIIKLLFYTISGAVLGALAGFLLFLAFKPVPLDVGIIKKAFFQFQNWVNPEEAREQLLFHLIFGGAVCGGIITGLLYRTKIQLNVQLQPECFLNIKMDFWLDLVLLGILFILLWVVNPAWEAYRIYQADHFHVWNYFIIGPGIQANNGKVAAIEFYSQYGIGLPKIWAWLKTFGFSGSVEELLPLASGFLIFYYFILWKVLGHIFPQALFIRVVTFGMALLLQVWGGAMGDKWAGPNSLLRSPLDMTALFLLLQADRKSSFWQKGSFYGAAIIAGSALFLITDSGIWLILAVTLCAVYFSDNIQEAITQGLLIITLSLTVFVILAIGSYGVSVLKGNFFKELFKPMFIYVRLGFFSMPLEWRWSYFLLNVWTPVVYAWAIIFSTVITIKKDDKIKNLPLFFLGILGFGLYHYYLNRSHPANWYHTCIPIVILSVFYIHNLAPSWARLKINIYLGRALVSLVLMLGIYFYSEYSHTATKYLFNDFMDSPNILWGVWNRGPKPVRPDYLQRYRQIALTIEQYTKPHSQVLILYDEPNKDNDGNIFLFLRNRKAWGRFLPFLQEIILQEDWGNIRREFQDTPPDYIVVVNNQQYLFQLAGSRIRLLPVFDGPQCKIFRTERK